MSKRTKRVLRIGLNWAILGAVVWTIIASIAFNVMDRISANFTGQMDAYNQAVHDQVPETAYAAYEQTKSPQVVQD